MIAFAVAVVAATRPPVGRDEARRQAREELSRATYHRYDDPWPVAVMKAIGRAIARIFDTATSHAPGGGAGAIALVALVVAVIAFARWRAGPLRRMTRAPHDVLAATAMSAAQHRALAHDAAAREDWHTAVIEAMRAVARGLEETGVLDPRPGRTADELARDAAAELPATRTVLHAAAMTFDAVAYGGRDGDLAAYDVVRRADEAVRGKATVGAP